MTLEVSHNEKRTEPRFIADANISVLLDDDRTVYGSCLNISSSGLLIRTTESIDKGMRVKLELIEAGKRIQVEGTVIHSKKSNTGYLVGLKARFSF